MGAPHCVTWSLCRRKTNALEGQGRTGRTAGPSNQRMLTNMCLTWGVKIWHMPSYAIAHAFPCHPSIWQWAQAPINCYSYNIYGNHISSTLYNIIHIPGSLVALFCGLKTLRFWESFPQGLGPPWFPRSLLESCFHHGLLFQFFLSEDIALELHSCDQENHSHAHTCCGSFSLLTTRSPNMSSNNIFNTTSMMGYKGVQTCREREREKQKNKNIFFSSCTPIIITKSSCQVTPQEL